MDTRPHEPAHTPEVVGSASANSPVAQSISATANWSSLGARLVDLVGSVNGRMGVCVRDIATGEETGARMDEPLPMASTCKVPILVAAYRQFEAGNLDLDERVEFGIADRCLGSGLLNAFTPGVRLTYRDLLLLMITVSDNAATDLVLRHVPPNVVTATMHELGLRAISVDRSIAGLIGDILTALDPRLGQLPFDSWSTLSRTDPNLHAISQDLDRNREAVNSAAAHRDVASARDMARLMALLASDACASTESCEAMRDMLNRQQLNTRLPRDLPVFVRMPHKTGTLGSGAVVNDVGVLYLNERPMAAIAVLSRDVRNPIHQTCAVIADMARAVHDYYTTKEYIE